MKVAGTVLLLLTLAMLLVGYLVGMGMGDKIAPHPPTTPLAGVSPRFPTPPPSPTVVTVATPTQVAFLLLVVDAFDADPQLEMCWVVTFWPDIPQYYLVGVPVSEEVTLPGAAPQSLQAIYAIDASLRRGNVFTRDALRLLFPDLAPPQTEITFDRATFTQAIDLLGGQLWQGQRHSGAEVLAAYDAIPPDDPLSQLSFQSTVWVNFFQAAKDRHWTLENLFAYINLGQIWSPGYDAVIHWSQTAPPLWEADFIPLLGLPFEAEPMP